MAEIKEFKNRMVKTAEVLSAQFDTVRAGRANAAVLDQIEVDYYGTPTPIRQIASISSPDARTLLIQPWDGSTLKLIEKAILTSELGINPQNDGRVIRLVFPQLTEERRKELAKQVRKYGEEAKVAVRNIRRDAMDKFKKEQKKGEITEDDLKDLEKDMQKLTDDYTKEVDKLTAAKEKLPRHIAIIMDGNGRWAKKRGLPRKAGHAVGAETFRRIATYCKNLGMDYLTVYAFSTENWKRSDEEVGAIMGLLENYLHESIEKMEKDRIRLKILGDTTALSPAIQGLIDKTDAIAARLPGCFQANVCLNYGGRDEIVRAVNRFAAEHPGETITEEAMAEYLDTAGIPDPDLIIRTGGEYRISNFLMWESAYSELYFTDVLWPDFSEKDIDEAVAEYRHRDRRFGGVKA